MSLAYYSHSMLLLSQVSQEGRSKLFVTARDMTTPPVGVSGGSRSLREAVGELEMLVPGSIQPPPAPLPLSKHTPPKHRDRAVLGFIVALLAITDGLGYA